MNLTVNEETAAGMAQGTVVRQDPPADTDITAYKRASIVTASLRPRTRRPMGKQLYYEIPQGGGDRQLRLVLLDDRGEKELFNGTRAPGTKLELPVDPQGRARIRIFINNILVEEREIK